MISGKKAAGILLIFLGIWLFFRGGDLWGFITFLVATALLVYGLVSFVRAKTGGHKAWALFVLVIGGLLMLRWIPFLAGVALGLFCVYYGLKLLTNSH
ncbi:MULTISPECIES: protein liaI [unclassified Thermoactinomyces]|uniref:protein liaI n=1 Tax=unclassified Thermoactinomyces TaxID=2634588 RepID=UPI0018DE155F|nr:MULTISPECIES: protein liaI [unclassified Thermoactinomyces]MBH8597959.1 protein liaI [Thermoactinomyces sp. CICC 10523]MBH8604313.1 protein liaI [Thermoactinomyces sp. CICC 10522]